MHPRSERRFIREEVGKRGKKREGRFGLAKLSCRPELERRLARFLSSFPGVFAEIVLDDHPSANAFSP